MAFHRASKFQKFLGEHAPRPLQRLAPRHLSSLPPHRQISSYGHEHTTDNRLQLLYDDNSSSHIIGPLTPIIHKMERDDTQVHNFFYLPLHFWTTMANHHYSHLRDWIFLPHNFFMTFWLGILVSSQKEGIHQSSFDAVCPCFAVCALLWGAAAVGLLVRTEEGIVWLTLISQQAC